MFHSTLYVRLRAGIKSEGTALRTLYFLAYASGAAWYPLFNVYLKESGLSGLQIGTIASIIPAVMLVSQPFWGMGADRWGRQRTLLLTMLLSSFLMLGFVWNGGFWFFFGWTILFALLFNPVAPLIDSFALDYVEKTRNSSYGRFRMWGAIGWATMAPIVGRVISGRDMKLIFPLGAIMMLLGWLIGLRTKREREDRGALEVSWQNLGCVLHDIRLLIFLFLALIFAVGTASIWTFYSVYLSDIGASRQLIGIAFGIQGVSELPFYFYSKAIIKRFGAPKTLFFAFLITTTRVFIYSFTSIPILAVAVDVTHGLTWALFIVASVEYVNQLVPSTWRATGQSLFWASYFGAGAILGNIWAGYLYDRMQIHGMFTLNGWIVLTVTLIALVALRGNHVKADALSLEIDKVKP